MKKSEIRLIAMLNKNNNVKLDPDQVSFGRPRVSPDKRYNTWIPTYANPTDKVYGKSTTTTYNRLRARTLGDGGVISIMAYEQRDVTEGLISYLNTECDIPTERSELICRTQTLLESGILVGVYDFNNHPLVFGTIICRAQLNTGKINNVIVQYILDGFTYEDIQPPKVSDALKYPDMIGFTLKDLK